MRRVDKSANMSSRKVSSHHLGGASTVASSEPYNNRAR